MGDWPMSDIVQPEDTRKRHYASVLANFAERMSISEAERVYEMRHGTLAAAIANGQCRAYRCGTRYKVCHQFIAEYVERYCIVQNDPLPG